MHRMVRELRGLPTWLLKDYMESLGGKATRDDCVEGPGWQARLFPMEDYKLGSLKVGQVRLEWEGDEQAYQEIWPRLEVKIIRVGG